MARLIGRPIVREGRTLDPQLQLILLMQRYAHRELVADRTVPEARAEVAYTSAIFAPSAARAMSVEDRTLPGPHGPIPIRVYRPGGVASPAPALVYLHGGGWVIGSIESHDGPCRALAEAAGRVVLSVDYRLAPEHRFPAAVEDCVAAFRLVVAQAGPLGLDRDHIAVGGDSAGGNLSAVVSQETRRDDVRPDLQLLIYPGVDFTQSFPSIQSLARGFLLEKRDIDFFIGHYLPAGHDKRDPRASPLYGDLRDLPPAFVMTAGFDPLRDEGDAYAKALAEAGVPVQHRRYDSLVHGFLSVAGYVKAARAGIDDAAAALRAAAAKPIAAAAGRA